MNSEPEVDGYNIDEGEDEEDDSLVDVYTVEDAINKMGCGVLQIFLALIAGGMWLVEAFEVMILSILSTVLKCEWNLSYFQEATITMVVFLGFLFGSPVWGAVADKFGRKKTLLIVQIWGVVFGVVSAFSPEYYSLLLFRGLLGFGLGGGFLGVAYCVEFLPIRTRPIIASFTQLSWAVGSVLEALLALVVMTNIHHESWRWLLGLSAVPLFVLTLLFPANKSAEEHIGLVQKVRAHYHESLDISSSNLKASSGSCFPTDFTDTAIHYSFDMAKQLIPESPRYLILNGEEDKAKKVLSWIARVNCSAPLSGRLVTQEEKEKLLCERQSESSSDQKLKLPVSTLEHHSNGRRSVTKETTNYGTLPNMEEPINQSDIQLSLISNENLHKHTLSCKEVISEKLANYYHWFLILFKNGYWKTTVLLWYLWWSANIVYYGGTLLTMSLFQHDQRCGFSGGNSTDEGCSKLSKSDYVHLVWTTCGEFPGTIFIILLLLFIGRKKSMALTTALAALSYGMLFFCLDKTLLTVFLFGIRGFASGFFQAIYLYTPEVYPTAVRAFGMSLCSSISRIGAMISPYIAQTLLAYNVIATISVFVVLSVMASLAALLLPIETRGRAMKDSGK